MDEEHNDSDSNVLIDRINNMELRISQLEANLNIQTITSKEEHISKLPEEELQPLTDKFHLETKFGESGLAWLGNFVLFFGIAFLVQYIQNIGYHIASSIFGYISVIVIFALSYFLSKTYNKIASIFSLNAYLLLFYVTLRLHFYTLDPILASKIIAVSLLTIVSSIQIIISVRKKSALWAGIALFLLSITAVVSNTTHFMLIISVVIAVISTVFLFRFLWIRLFYESIILSYLINFLWLLNNPVIGNKIQLITNHNFGYIYLFLVAAIYSLGALLQKSDSTFKNRIITSLVLNGVGFSFLLLLFGITFFKNNFVMMVGMVSIYCIAYSVLLQLKSEWKITASLFALYGFITLSTAAYGLFQFPHVYFVLAIQSLLVVSMAIWFRSRFIVIINTLLFISLLIFYLSTSSLLNGVNISFSIVALATARILNWKKDRLTIKTDIYRNIYMVLGFVMILITLAHIMPVRFITLSWTCAAVVYFGLSMITKNAKYRYMALGTLLAAAVYLFLIDLATIELVFRIIALMFFATISIGISIYYSKKSKNKSPK